MPRPVPRSCALWTALGAALAAGCLFGRAWVLETDEWSPFPVPLLGGGVALILLGGAVTLARGARRGLLEALAAGLAGMMVMDLLQRWEPWSLPTGPTGSLAARVWHNVGLHMVPASTLAAGVVVALLLARGLGLPAARTAFAPGSWTMPASSLSEPPKTTWRAVALRFCVAVVLADVALLLIRGASWDPIGPWILIPISAGMAATAAAEEVLFRGLIRTAAEEALGPARGNLLQAGLFSLCHVSFALLASGDPRLAGREGARFLLWFLLAWFFGLAARDTRGVGVPVLLHTVLGLAIYVSLVFKPAHGFLG